MMNLDEQLKGGAGILQQQVQEQRANVRAQAENQKAVYATAVDHEVRMMEMQVEHNYARCVKELKQQSAAQRTALEQQCLHLTHDYQTRKAEEDMLIQHHDLHQVHLSVQEQLRSLPRVIAPSVPTTPVLQPVMMATPRP